MRINLYSFRRLSDCSVEYLRITNKPDEFMGFSGRQGNESEFVETDEEKLKKQNDNN